MPTRKKIIGDIRTENLAWLKSNDFTFTPSQSNCYMIDTKRPGAEIIAAMAKKEIFIGRAWPAWPTFVRITVGTKEEMAAFQTAFKEVMSAPPSSTAGLKPEPMHKRLRNSPHSWLS